MMSSSCQTQSKIPDTLKKLYTSNSCDAKGPFISLFHDHLNNMNIIEHATSPSSNASLIIISSVHVVQSFENTSL